MDDTARTNATTSIVGSTAMITVLMSQTEIVKMRLPSQVKGRYWFGNKREDHGLLYIEGIEGQWYVGLADAEASFISHPEVRQLAVGDKSLIAVQYHGSEYALFSEQESNNRRIYRHFAVEDNVSITIGRSPGSDIFFNSRFASKNHASLFADNNQWRIVDTNSTNGVYVNNKRVHESSLRLGDVVFIMGLNIIIGTGFIAINSDDERVKITPEKLKVFKLNDYPDGISISVKSDGEKLYNRLPRRRKALKLDDIHIEAPPMSLDSAKIPLVLRLGGQAVMSGAAALSGNYTMLLTSLLFPVLTQKYSDKERKEYEARRVDKYTKYLEKRKIEITSAKHDEEQTLNNNYPPLSTVLRYAMEGSKLWERRAVDDDFMKLRVGHGDIPLLAKIDYPSRRFSIEEDELEKSMYNLAERPVILHNAPILVDFYKDFICGITGERDWCLQLTKSLIARIASLYSYDEVKIVLLAEPAELDNFSNVKYLPHVFDDQRIIRFIADDPSSAYKVGETLKESIIKSPNHDAGQRDYKQNGPYYVVFALSKRVFDCIESFKDIMQQKNNSGITLFTVFDDVPKETSVVLHCGNDRVATVQHISDIEKEDDRFELDAYSLADYDKCMSSVANTSLKVLSESYALPKMLSFLEMFNVGRIEHLNIAKRWEESNPVKSLAVPVGVATDGSPFLLDLHQKYQGPHGLVAGMTGSGKSEFLLTYILSLAVNFDPNEVAFVLIDYKGGGLAGAFDNPEKGIHLPHLVGTITNLDGSTIQRSLLSIESELKRRQRVFNEVKNIAGDGTMDIYSYQRLFRSGLVREPMPHLFIISDEFAELKQQEPEFMDKLISAARIGRSLGIHLILATQKPAGIVNDQILSNTKFRVCLKVQDRNDSMDMLKRPEAAELRDTGRFYLQVGYNEYFALGQSAWSGAEYEPQDEVIIKKDDSLQFIDIAGQNMLSVSPKTQNKGTGKSQLVEIVQALSALAKEQKRKPHSLWQPELPRTLDYDSINPLDKEAGQIINLGIADDPENQKQFLAQYNITTPRNMLIIGNARTGKTTLLETIVFGIAKRFSPLEANFYCLDYSSRMLKKLQSLPHCGGVLLEEDDGQLEAFFKTIDGIIAERKQLYSKLGIDSFCTASSVQKMPLVYVLIDNIAGMGSSKKGENLLFSLPSRLRNCNNYGVKFVVTCNNLNEIATRLKSEFQDRICLHLKDKFDYNDALSAKINHQPADIPGRGIMLLENRPLEVQFSIFHTKKQAVLDVVIEAIAAQYRGIPPVKHLPVIDSKATYEEFAMQFSGGRIPLGYYVNERKPIALPLKQFSLLTAYLGNPAGLVQIFNNVLFAASREKMQVWVFKSKTGSAIETSLTNNSHVQSIKLFNSTAEDIKLAWKELSSVVISRKELCEKLCQAEGITFQDRERSVHAFYSLKQDTIPILILFENLSDFCKNADLISSNIFSKFFEVSKGLNIYYWGFILPDGDKGLESNSLFRSFISEEMFLLFGGQLHKQWFCDILSSDRHKELRPYNQGVMYYRGNVYPMLMPCGDIADAKEDPDDLSLF